jgi:hypothetical protein
MNGRTMTLLAALAILASAGAASAHVTRTAGAYSLKVGWAVEPPETDTLNHVTLEVWDTQTRAGVTDLADALNATVTYAGASKLLDLSETDEAPGNYSAPLDPTMPGIYVVHVEGSVRGTPVSLDFEVQDVKDIGEDRFPPVNGTAEKGESPAARTVPGAGAATTMALAAVAALGLHRRGQRLRGPCRGRG